MISSNRPAHGEWGAKAYGKVILLGEHAVVYGHPALAGAIDRGVSCRHVPPRSDSCSQHKSTQVMRDRLRIPGSKFDVHADDPHPAARAFAAILQSSHVGGVDIELQSDLPIASGLGSSAAFCVAIARLFVPANQVLDVAECGEKWFHDSPSGIDASLSHHGGIGVFQKSTGLIPLHGLRVRLVIALSGLRRRTAQMVAKVRNRIQQDSDVRRSIDTIATITQDGVTALAASDYKELGMHMNRCHRELCTIGVSHPTLNTMVKIALDAGAFGAKLTGAGGGGAVIALTPDANCATQVANAFRTRGYENFITMMGATSQ